MLIKATGIAVVVTVAFVIYPSRSSQVVAQVPVVTIEVPKIKCKVKQKTHKKYVRAVYRRKVIRRKAHMRIQKMENCAITPKAKKNMRQLRKQEKRLRDQRKLDARVYPVSAHLRAIARCESGGNPRAISAGGTYRGKYQFSFQTWRSVGGVGDPAQASEYEQDRRADILYKRDGPGQWPVCGR